MDTQITLVGDATGDATLRYTTTGVAIGTFTVAATPRTFDKQTGTWRDGEPVFLRVTSFRALAENTATSVLKGTRVLIAGRLCTHTWEADDGTRRATTEVDADEIATSLRFTATTPTHATRTTATNAGDGDGPWASTGAASVAGDSGNGGARP